MKNCFKKIFLLLIAVCTTLAISSCKKDDKTVYYEVKYMVENTEHAKYSIEKGKTAPEIVAPELEDKIFQYWELNGHQYDFTTPVNANLTFVAKYNVNESGVPAAVKAILEKIVSGAEYTKKDVEATEEIKAEYTAVKDGKTTTIYYLEKANTFTTVKMYVGIADGAVVNMVTTQATSHGMDSSFNGTKMEIIGATNATLDGVFKSVSGATISSTTVKELMKVAFTKYATDNQEVETVTVSFDTDGGTEIPDIKVILGEKFVRPNDPTREGYYFVGWTLDGEDYDFNTSVTKDITLVANWVTHFQFDRKTQMIVDAFDISGDIVIPEEINGIEVLALGENLFKGNTSITSVTIPVGKATTEDKAAYEIKLSAFEGCTNLKKVTFVTTDESRIITFGNKAFAGCTALAQITIPASTSVISSGMFEGCTALETVTINAAVTAVGSEAFKDCAMLKSITLLSGTREISKNAFENCRSLTTVVLSDTLTTIGEQAFKGCVSITTISIPATVTNISLKAFTDCNKLAAINVEETSAKYSSENGVLYNKVKTTLMIAPNRELTTIEIPATVTSIETGAFANLVNLTTITVAEGSTKYVAEGGVLYYNNSATTTRLELIPAKYTGEVKFLANTTAFASGVFANCPEISKITIDENNTRFQEVDHLIYSVNTNKNTYWSLVVANRDFAGVATILKDKSGFTLSSIDANAFTNTTLSGIRFTSTAQIISVQTNIFASVPANFKVYVPNGTTNSFIGMSNTRWCASLKQAVKAMIVEDSAE